MTTDLPRATIYRTSPPSAFEALGAAHPAFPDAPISAPISAPSPAEPPLATPEVATRPGPYQAESDVADKARADISTTPADRRAEAPASAPSPFRPAPRRQAAPALPARPEPAADSLRHAGPTRRRDPAPSRLSYRLQRLWLTPVFRSAFRVGLPVCALLLAAGLYLADDARRDALYDQGRAIVRQVQERPEFMVNLMAVEGASPTLGAAIRTALPVDFPVSSFDLDLKTMRDAVAALDAVAEAEIAVRAGGILEVRVKERVPAILWRSPHGLQLLDASGHPVARAASRLERPDLAVIAGEGAEAAVPEALSLIEAARPVAARIRGLVRMGERRWDLVLDNGQRILLPEEGALAALERVMALAEAEDMLARDVSVIDMRYGQRPTLRLSPRALDVLRGRVIEAGANSG